MSALLAERVCGKELAAPSLLGTEQSLDSVIVNSADECAGPSDPDAEADIRRWGFFAHELRNHLQTAMLVTQMMRSDSCCAGGTLETLERSLRGLRDMIDRSLSEARLAAGIHHKEQIRVANVMEEMGLVASMEAAHRGIQFDVERSDRELMIDADRQLFE